MNEPSYSIKDLEIISGIKAHTIRIWEKRYHVLSPKRTETNIRYYTDEDLKRMINISLLVRKGYKISKVAQWDEKQISETVLKMSGQKTDESDYVDQLILHMVNFDNIGFDRFTGEIIESIGIEKAVTKIFFDFFIRVGAFWQAGTIFPAQEHYVSSIFRQKLIAAIDREGIKNTKGATILFFLPQDEMHEMSLLFYSYLAHKAGYNVIYLGQFVPFDDLQKIHEHTQIDYVFTAFINAILKEDLETYLLALKEQFPRQKIFVTGWQLHNLNPEIPRNVKIVKDYHDFNRYLR